MTIESPYEVIIDSGILIKYIQAYFRKISLELTPLHYKGLQWEVILTPIFQDSNKITRSVYIPRTEIRFIGEREAVEEVVHAYRLEFLSAGG
ncbi:hypothetical protein [Fusibacter ferrireducens]|uniref:Molybdopterin cofactor biosynthesis MoaD-related C-terminal domain-containing protein n=1 Tax=Fusibacter ferrireducens TaxID=2785058 RepID=A0ABR9ZR20_9FIRM|nr:hypothetical protein [Fusibacter ferrireducens]MBF4692907.1 hypothetical protein [Fusibacter ferrireducens]